MNFFYQWLQLGRNTSVVSCGSPNCRITFTGTGKNALQNPVSKYCVWIFHAAAHAAAAIFARWLAHVHIALTASRAGGYT